MDETNNDELQKQQPKEGHKGDKFSIKNIGKGSVIAAGRNAVAKITNLFNITIYGDVKLLPVVIVLICGIGLLSFLFLQLRPPPACLDEMTGNFNVAVSEFMVIDADGEQIDDQSGKDLANFIYDRIVTNFSELNLESIVSYKIWEPDCTGKISGESVEDRRQSAESLAEKINAHVIIFGLITYNEERSTFDLEFYVNHSSFQEADEISGNHDFGSPLRIPLPFDEIIQPIENPALAARVTALNQITVGLVYYSVDNYEKAIEYFLVAKNNHDWLDIDGKEIIYLLLGNANVRLSSREITSEFLSAALNYYEYALTKIDPDYGRAIIGYASVLYLQALGEPPDLTIDQEKLLEVETWLDRAMHLEVQPESANIETKAHYYFGQINLARAKAQIPGGEWLEIAEKEFEYVIKDFEGGDLHIKTFASKAYVGLGLIAYNKNNFNEAEEFLKTAISIASPFYEGEYYAILGTLYDMEGFIEKAIEAYEEAIMVARSNSDEIRLEKYTEELLKIRSSE